jgi:hypothetical protein
MKTKAGNANPMPACYAHGISKTTAIPPVILASTIANTERYVGLCLLADGNQF